MCLGGHLAYRCALDKRISAAVCYFATDIHSRSLGKGKQDDSLQRAKDIKGELVMVSRFSGLTNEWDLICSRRSSVRRTTMFHQKAEI